MDKKQKTADFLSKRNLVERGWTRTSIQHFLGNPDATKTNPCYRSAPPMCLYNPERVKTIENSEEWCRWRDQKNIRSEAATKVAEKKAKELQTEVDKWKPKLPRMPIEEVRRRAIRAYNDWNVLYDKSEASESSNASFLDRITVNYLRHETTDYDSMLAEVAGKIGVRTAKCIIRKRVYDVIADTYPELASETDRQILDKGSRTC